MPQRVLSAGRTEQAVNNVSTIMDFKLQRPAPAFWSPLQHSTATLAEDKSYQKKNYKWAIESDAGDKQELYVLLQRI